MKSILLTAFLAVLVAGGFAPNVHAAAATKYSLMKCGSTSLGSLWVSFGHRYTSGETTITHFPSEIIYVSHDEKILRRSFRNGNESLGETITQASAGAVSLSLQSPWGPTNGGHTLTLAAADPRAPGVFKGKWEVWIDGQVVATDRSVFCTIL